MTGDHLAARQAAYTTLMRHSLTDLSSGIYSREDNGSYDWAAATAASKIWLPRCGKVGTQFYDVGLHPNQSENSTTSSGFTMECVYLNTNTNYNFFGGIWARWPMHYYGNDSGQYALRYGLELYPLNDSISDTSGRIRALVSDVGGDWLSSRTIHSRVAVSDGLPHHICMTHAGSPTLTDAVKVYVDGVLVETATLASGRTQATWYANRVNVGVYNSFVNPYGSISHACVTPQVLPAAEIKARAQLVNGVSGTVLTDQGGVMAWDNANSAWRPVKGSDSSAWPLVRPPS